MITKTIRTSIIDDNEDYKDEYVWWLRRRSWWILLLQGKGSVTTYWLQGERTGIGGGIPNRVPFCWLFVRMFVSVSANILPFKQEVVALRIWSCADIVLNCFLVVARFKLKILFTRVVHIHVTFSYMTVRARDFIYSI